MKALTLLLVALFIAAVDLSASERKPNIIFAMVDDLGKEWVGCYGAEEVKTPNIDRLADTGMQFNNVYSMPQCTPTRVTLLTGQYPFRHGWINHWDVPRWGRGCHFDPKHNLTFARLLREAGYATCAAGKWQINDFRVQPDAMVQHGFDEYCMWTGYEAQNPPSAERYWDPYIHTKEGSRTLQGEYGPEVCFQFMADFIRKHKDEPMMVYWPMILTHTPFVSTPLKPDVTAKKEQHIAMVEYVDHMTGRLTALLDELGIREDTIIIWTTDNGTTGGMTGLRNGYPEKGAKGATLENGVCEPFIVNGPGRVPAGVVTDALSDFTDLLPTFADLAGAAIPESLTIDGKSLAPLITGQADDSPREWIMAMGGQPGAIDDQGRVINTATYRDRVIRDKRFKLYINQQAEPEKLIDLANDPHEKTNVIDSKDPEIVAARQKLEAVAAGFPDKDANPIYDPLPPQPWDVKRTELEGKPKKPKGEKDQATKKKAA